jgi:hypothetical protein
MRGESRNWAAKLAAALFVVVMACGAMYGQDIITRSHLINVSGG